MTPLPKALHHFAQSTYTVTLCTCEEQRLLPSCTATVKGSSKQGRKTSLLTSATAWPYHLSQFTPEQLQWLQRAFTTCRKENEVLYGLLATKALNKLGLFPYVTVELASKFFWNMERWPNSLSSLAKLTSPFSNKRRPWKCYQVVSGSCQIQ